MELGKIINEGKSKIIYQINKDINFMTFKPHLRSITSKREENISGTEIERLKCCCYFLSLLDNYGIKTELIDKKIVSIDGKMGLLVKPISPIPIEFIARFYAAGSIVRQFPSLVTENQRFETTLYKYDYKQDISVSGVDDPMLNESYITGLGLLSYTDFEKCKKILAQTASILNDELTRKGIKLIDFKMELGIDTEGNIVIIDEISQDCIRANDIQTDISLTKDTFRQWKTDEDVLNSYKTFTRRLVKKDR